MRDIRQDEDVGPPRAGPADRPDGSVSVVDAGAELRRETNSLRSTVQDAVELLAAAEREENFQRATAGRRERQLAVTGLVLDCLRRQQTMTDRLLTCLTEQQGLSERLSQRVDALERQVTSLIDRPREGGRPVSEGASAMVSPETTVESVAADPADALNGGEPRDAEAGTASPPLTGARRRGPIGRLLAGPLSREGRACAVCQRHSPSKTRRDLVQAGWTVAGQLGVCPGCRSAGWRLGDAGGVPFRQGTMTGG